MNQRVFDALFELVPEDRQKCIFNDIHLRMQKFKKRYFDHHRMKGIFANPIDTDDLAYAAIKVKKIRTIVVSILVSTFKLHLSSLLKGDCMPETVFVKRLDDLSRLFDLTVVERDLLAVMILRRQQEQLDTLFDNVPSVSNAQRLLKYKTFVPHPDYLSRKALGPDGTLRRLGFVDSDGDVSIEISEFIDGLRSTPLTDIYFSRFEGSALPLDRLMIRPEDIETIRSLLKNRRAGQGINILLAGPPGTGKTETVRALSKQFGLDLFEIRSSPNLGEVKSREAGGTTFRMRALYACRHGFGKDSRTAILIDEADELLGSGVGSFLQMLGIDTPKAGKAQLNEALDSATCVQFWIANSLQGMDSSTRRRFAFAIQYQRTTSTDRLKIWETAVERHGLARLVLPEDRKRFSARYDIDAGGIDSALRHSANLARRGGGRKLLIGQIDRLLASQTLFTGKKAAPALEHLHTSEHVDLAELTIAPRGDLERVLEIVSSGRLKPGDGRPRAMSILLEGPPGTGKTHFARHVADVLKAPLHVKTASHILNMYVGQTEQRIREAFEAAEREDAVLFFDEIDGLLGGRERSHHSWEVTQVNELLSALEAFRGVFIAATNHAALLDKAARRRFQFSLSFGPLAQAAVLSFYRRFLAPLCGKPPAKRVIDTLSGMAGLVPSDFACTRDRFALQPDARPSHEELLAVLDDVRRNRLPSVTRSIGFHAA